jgi:hypothetical protein
VRLVGQLGQRIQGVVVEALAGEVEQQPVELALQWPKRSGSSVKSPFTGSRARRRA